MSISPRRLAQKLLRGRILAGFGLLLSSPFSLLVSAQKLPDPIIVSIKEPETSELGGLANVLIGSLGVAGIMILLSVFAAVVFAGVLFWIRSRAD